MAHHRESDQEIEQSRLEKLEAFDGLKPENFRAGSHGCHEALHTAYLMMSIVEQHLLDHPAILLHPAWYARATRAVEELGALYQDIGAEHPS